MKKKRVREDTSVGYYSTQSSGNNTPATQGSHYSTHYSTQKLITLTQEVAGVTENS